MNSIKYVLLFLFAGTLLVGCSKGKYKKTKGGMPYQVFEGKDTQKVRLGNYIKVEYTQKIKDSVSYTTVGTLPEFRAVKAESTYPYDISELWTSLELGDSVVAIQMIDTFINRRPQDIPKQYKKGDKITHYIKIVGIFTSDSAAQADFDKTNKEYLPAEIKKVEQYLAEKKINAVKTPSGAFMEIIKQGTGPLVDTGNYVSVNYTGATWTGRKFDSNTDPAFGHTTPYAFTAGKGEMIKGFDEAVVMMNPGMKVKVYIPSIIAYGAQPPPQSGIKPYEMLVFDLEVVDVKDKMPAQPQPPMRQNVDIPQPNN